MWLLNKIVGRVERCVDYAVPFHMGWGRRNLDVSRFEVGIEGNVEVLLVHVIF